MAVTPTELRRDVYRLLDQVLETGEPLEIERNGRILRIEAVEPGPRPSLFDRLTPHPDAIIGDPDDLIHIDWSGEWRPFL